ncbi:MAG: helix-turn-helix domain-containing protein [Bacteroidota bacterium]|nr:helix-turn-helix domain-containing protein [Bacteroidota bacterium]
MTDREFYKAVGENVRKRRLKKKWTQIKLGDETGLDAQNISRIELGYNSKLKTLKKLAEALGCSVADLVKVK